MIALFRAGAGAGPAGTEHPSHVILRSLLDKGGTWIKLSGAYSNSNVGSPDYPKAARVAQAFVKAAPERPLWGSTGRIRASGTGPFQATPFCSTCSVMDWLRVGGLRFGTDAFVP
jgi:hypothetical protein